MITVYVPDHGEIAGLPDMSIEQLRRTLVQQLGLTQVQNAPVEVEETDDGHYVTFQRRAGGQKADE